MNIDHHIQQYRSNLFEDVIPFWTRHSMDELYGGYFTCLTTKGEVYDTDKFIWLQCRQVWCFAMLYNQVEQRAEWLDIAEKGARFLMKHGRDEKGYWYFSLNRQGHPLVQPYNIFSDCFAAMAFGQLYKATGNSEYNKIAVRSFEIILQRKNNPKGPYLKAVSGTCPMKGFSLPMILSNLVLEIEDSLSPELVESTIDTAIDEVMNVFLDKETGLILENVGPAGERIDNFDGRLINPGHGLEAMWFMMELGVRRKDQQLIQQAKDTALSILEYGWDKQFGGIFYFLDRKGHPTQQLEWDQKLWWVHAETLVCMLKGFLLTGDKACWNWFEKVHDYTWKHFPDPQHGEWFGYLNRRGEVLLQLKGGKWKGCFHVPRSLYQCWKTLDAIKETYSQPLELIP
jgi:N-acylglucosamine 2-epimerase